MLSAAVMIKVKGTVVQCCMLLPSGGKLGISITSLKEVELQFQSCVINYPLISLSKEQRILFESSFKALAKH